MPLKRQRGRLAATLLVAASTQGCLSGWLYTNVTVPVVVDVGDTPKGQRSAELHNYEVNVRNITWANVNSQAIGEAAKNKGLERVDLADLQTISVFGGVFKQNTIRVWGE